MSEVTGKLTVHHVQMYGGAFHPSSMWPHYKNCAYLIHIIKYCINDWERNKSNVGATNWFLDCTCFIGRDKIIFFKHWGDYGSTCCLCEMNIFLTNLTSCVLCTLSQSKKIPYFQFLKRPQMKLVVLWQDFWIWTDVQIMYLFLHCTECGLHFHWLNAHCLENVLSY